MCALCKRVNYRHIKREIEGEKESEKERERERKRETLKCGIRRMLHYAKRVLRPHQPRTRSGLGSGRRYRESGPNVK